MFNTIKMAGERDIYKRTKRLKIDRNMVDTLLSVMLDNIKNVSDLNEEDFYLLDCLIKCELILVGIDVEDDYSENVKHLLEYCKQYKKEKSHMQRGYSYTYVALTENNVDKLISWILKKSNNPEPLSYNENEILKDLQECKLSFYSNVNDIDILMEVMQEIESANICI